jgi:hypothetical protein
MFDNISDEQLQEELKRREAVKQTAEKPIQLASLDYDNLRELGKKYINDITNGEFVSEDYIHWFYEAAIEMLYGEDIWNWIRQQRYRELSPAQKFIIDNFL